MELDKTDEVVAHVREWSIDRIDNTNHENAEAIYEEFEEWIDLDDEDSHLDILTLEPLEDDKSYCCWWWQCWMYHCFISFMVQERSGS